MKWFMWYLMLIMSKSINIDLQSLWHIHSAWHISRSPTSHPHIASSASTILSIHLSTCLPIISVHPCLIAVALRSASHNWLYLITSVKTTMWWMKSQMWLFTAWSLMYLGERDCGTFWDLRSPSQSLCGISQQEHGIVTRYSLQKVRSNSRKYIDSISLMVVFWMNCIIWFTL